MPFKTVRAPGLVQVADPGNAGRIEVPQHHNMVCILTSAGAETRNIPIPKFVGQTCTLGVDAQLIGFTIEYSRSSTKTATAL